MQANFPDKSPPLKSFIHTHIHTHTNTVLFLSLWRILIQNVKNRTGETKCADIIVILESCDWNLEHCCSTKVAKMWVSSKHN